MSANTSLSSPVTGPWSDSTLPVADRVEALLAQMTLEEKASQLGSYWEQVAPKKDDAGSASGEKKIGEAAPMQDAMSASQLPWDEEIVDGLGQISRVFGTRPVTAAEGVAALRARQQEVMSSNRFRIPALAHEECLTGFTAFGATVYPTSLAWGATFNPELIRQMAERIGEDLRAVGIQQGLSPVLDVVTDARWGRVEETIGEDPYVIGTLATAYVQGLQKSGVIATLKHFAGYSASKGARNHAPVHMGRRELIDQIFYPFELAVREGGVKSVMNSYADIDGEAPAASRWLLTEVLREEWGFEGTVVADYFAVSFLQKTHRVAETLPEAANKAISAGLDVELPQTAGFRTLPEQVRRGLLEEEVLNTAVRRHLLHKAEQGLLDRPETEHGSSTDWEPQVQESVDLDSAENRALARTIASKSLVLLKNEAPERSASKAAPILPLDAGALAGRRIAVIGPSATTGRTMLGCYSFANHVMSKYKDDELGIHLPTLLEEAHSRLGGAGVEVTAAAGCPIVGYDDAGIPAAAETAAAADFAVVTVGDQAGLFGHGTSGEGCDAEDLKLPGAQQELIEAVAATGTPVILVVISGRPYALGAVAQKCAAIVQGFFPGQEGAPAVLDLLLGEIEPSGRLPIGIPQHPGGQPAGYIAPKLGQRTKGVSNLDPTPLYPFGHGLSYTTLEYSNLVIEAPGIAVDGTVNISATVTNTGSRPADEVVQLYFGDRAAQVTRPVRQLLAYAHVELAPGESREVTFWVHADRFSFTGLDYRRIVEPGAIDIWVGPSSGDLPLEGELTLVGETREVTGHRVMTTPARVS
ncbi:glycoside hydrolase family 3 N-terminal domain-containing protein [Nesterenkonia flava]|uniref:Glycoside hydrolase family 3 N-terminal domain-containing protein n=1 Tax=Nesterenkonia flava TaxID=469799 RepID=A0ABU1FVS5_9MICC|nr:glycoside hydrolase family 3 N-terminal domain-containing protein [Nesterenkonia flava]MDR5712278.1 glycoside hydrolase family 3 N-terminal domain-containing protein [Nesterenkonia flava]